MTGTRDSEHREMAQHPCGGGKCLSFRARTELVFLCASLYLGPLMTNHLLVDVLFNSSYDLQ